MELIFILVPIMIGLIAARKADDLMYDHPTLMVHERFIVMVAVFFIFAGITGLGSVIAYQVLQLIKA